MISQGALEEVIRLVLPRTIEVTRRLSIELLDADIILRPLNFQRKDLSPTDNPETKRRDSNPVLSNSIILAYREADTDLALASAFFRSLADIALTFARCAFNCGVLLGEESSLRISSVACLDNCFVGRKDIMHRLSTDCLQPL